MAGQAVALIPGFLGFNHRRGTTYFADRFVAGLRTRLEATCGAPFPVVPVSTLPLSSLAQRQDHLVRDLSKLSGTLGNPVWHLLGHSTGGLDAAMLARTHRLRDAADGSIFSSDHLHIPNLASVTTVGAPHYGTGLALSSLASLFRGNPSRLGLQELLKAAADSVRRDKLQARLEFILPSLGHTSGFYRNFFAAPLIRDLRPAIAAALTRADNRRKGIPVTSFVTIAPPPAPHPPDPLFADLWLWTQENVEQAEPPPPFPQLSPDVVIASHPGIPDVDARSSDGVVNTVRQFDPGGAFGGLVVGDHGDVIGRYQRYDALDGKLIDPGLLTSGADFQDNQFFAVLDRVADSISAIHLGGVAGRAAE